MRAVAIFLVFYWHFVHLSFPTSMVPSFFLVSILEEGHTGVSLFMVLSGYLFARLTDGKKILFLPFLWNRFLRLAPMLSIVFLGLFTLTDFTMGNFLKGFVFPYNWRAGAWSIACELQFYLVFPFLMAATRIWGNRVLLVCLVTALTVRASLWGLGFDIKQLSYFTLAGRIDQFLAGILFSRLAGNQLFRKNATTLLLGAVLTFGAVWHQFNVLGGYGDLKPLSLWIGVPLFEATMFGTAIAAYENLKHDMPPLISRAVAHVGCISYSLYLIHIFMVETVVAAYVPRAETHMEAAIYAVLAFPVFVFISTYTYKCIELPFLKFRTRYLEGHPQGQKSGVKATA